MQPECAYLWKDSEFCPTAREETTGSNLTPTTRGAVSHSSWAGSTGQPLDDAVAGETLLRLANDSYYGGVFLTDAGSPMLEMLVNREGFIPDEGFMHLVGLVRRGIDLSVRLRASVQSETRSKRDSDSAGYGTDAQPADVEETLKVMLNSISDVRVHTKDLGRDGEVFDEALERTASTVRGAQRAISAARLRAAESASSCKRWDAIRCVHP